MGESVDKSGSGGVHIIFGGPTGLTGSASQFWSQSPPGVPGVSEDDDRFGGTVAAGDFGRNPRSKAVDDLAVVAHNDSVRETELAGTPTVLYGGIDGLAAEGSQRWAADDLGLPADGFGWYPETITS